MLKFIGWFMGFLLDVGFTLGLLVLWYYMR